MLIFSKEPNELKKAANLLNEGKLVAFPTETVYGVGCVYDNLDAFNNLNRLKRRAPDKPYTLMLADVNEIDKYAKVSTETIKFIKKYLPGSVTFLLPVKPGLATYLSKDNIIGIRIPSNSEALTLLKEVKKPLLVPSLNRSGEPPIKDKEEIIQKFTNELDGLIIGEITENIPSTVVYLNNKDIKVIREGKVPSKEIIKEFNNL